MLISEMQFNSQKGIYEFNFADFEYLAHSPSGLVEERLRGADRGLVGGDRLGEIAPELSAGDDPGAQGAGRETREK